MTRGELLDFLTKRAKEFSNNLGWDSGETGEPR